MFQLIKYKDGPILVPDKNLPWETEGVFNPGVVKTNGEIAMLYRAVGERDSYVSRFGLAKSKDGINFTRVSDEPVFSPKEFFDKGAVEDPRITKIGDDYFVTYVAVPSPIMKNGEPLERFLPLETLTALLKTRDFISYENLGVISPANSDNKDIVIFPKKINGKYVMLHRPNRWTKSWISSSFAKHVDEGLPVPVSELPDVPGIWVAWSDDLLHWRDHTLLMKPSHSDDAKIGPGLPPIETPDGWLIIYHHVTQDDRTNELKYTARAALVDLEDPTKLVSRIEYDILSPSELYEKNIVFPTGGFIDGDTLYVYYGASDNSVGLATGSIKELLEALNV